jgi:hypothetical protein
VFPPALYKISKDGVRFDGCLICEVAIHRGSQFGTRCSTTIDETPSSQLPVGLLKFDAYNASRGRASTQHRGF